MVASSSAAPGWALSLVNPLAFQHRRAGYEVAVISLRFRGLAWILLGCIFSQMLRACNIFTSLHPTFSPPHHNFLAGNRLCSWLWKGRDFYSCISKMTVVISLQLWHVSAEMWALLTVLGSTGLADGSCVIRQETTRNGGSGGSGTGVVGLEVGPEAWSQDGKWILGSKKP